MPKDIIITPTSGLIDFQGNTGISSATIQLDNNGNLNISSPNGDLTLGNTARDVFIGDGVNSIDIVFEQSGEIRGLTGKTITLGQSDSFIRVSGQVLGEIDVTQGPLLVGTATSTGTASQPLQVVGGAYVSGNVGINSVNPASRLAVGGTITELSNNQYWNVVTQADVGIGASQVPLNQYLGQLAFLDEFGVSIPQNAQTAAYTLVRADAGKHISITTGGVTVPAGVFEIGDKILIYNNSVNPQTITQGASATLRLSGTTTTGNRTLGQYGLATILCVASNTFVIYGNGSSLT